jgi:hypothetical protein
MTFKEQVGMACFANDIPPAKFIATVRELGRLGWKIVGPEPSEKAIMNVADHYGCDIDKWRETFGNMLRIGIATSPSVDELLAEGEGK